MSGFINWLQKERELREQMADLCERLGMQGYGSLAIAAAIRGGRQADKQCPPCHGDCRQGRDCPARRKA